MGIYIPAVPPLMPSNVHLVNKKIMYMLHCICYSIHGTSLVSLVSIKLHFSFSSFALLLYTGFIWPLFVLLRLLLLSGSLALEALLIGLPCKKRYINV